MLAYPLLFSYRGEFDVSGRTASVELDGGAVVTVEPEGFYLAHGLRPGGVCGEGQDLFEAYVDFKKDVTATLSEFAREEPDLAAFRRRVQKFFDEVDNWATETFEQARVQVRKGLLDAGELPKVGTPRFEARVVPADKPEPADGPPPPPRVQPPTLAVGLAA